jgi:hypothetical protein
MSEPQESKLQELRAEIAGREEMQYSEDEGSDSWSSRSSWSSDDEYGDDNYMAVRLDINPDLRDSEDVQEDAGGD